MKRFASLFAAFGLATAGSTALAAQPDAQIQPQNPAPQPVQMSDAQLDNVAAGQMVQIGEGLVTVQVGDVDVDIPVRILNNSVNNNQIQIPIAAGVGAGVLGNGAGGGIAGAFGRNN
jgi:hypothetical protein